MGVMLQAFYWDCPKTEDREHQWWAYIKSKLPTIAQAGFTALWLPPANKAAGWKSMGYDPYDYYDLGEFDQKGGVPTWFGSKAELLDFIQAAHAFGLQVYADLVFNHNSGADAQELNPGRSSRRRAANFRVTGNVFIPASMKPGMASLSVTCRIFVIVRLWFTPSSLTTLAGCWKK
jgi:alpha-amylase